MPPPPLPRALTDHIDSIDRRLMAMEAALRRTRQRLYAFEVTQQLAEMGRKPRFKIEFTSQFGEDLWIWDVLGGQTEGFFIEVGAFDGYKFSVTYALEAVGWNGLLIEALPDPYAACVKRRPFSRVVNTAVGRRNAVGPIEFVEVQDQENKGMLSFMKAATDHARMVASRNMPTRTHRVPITTINELLKDHQGPVDVAMIDVEGAELDVLDGFDLLKHKPRVLLLEDNSLGRDPALADYMRTKPYVFAGWCVINQVYIRADEERLLERMAT